MVVHKAYCILLLAALSANASVLQRYSLEARAELKTPTQVVTSNRIGQTTFPADETLSAVTGNIGNGNTVTATLHYGFLESNEVTEFTFAFASDHRIRGRADAWTVSDPSGPDYIELQIDQATNFEAGGSAHSGNAFVQFEYWLHDPLLNYSFYDSFTTAGSSHTMSPVTGILSPGSYSLFLRIASTNMNDNATSPQVTGAGNAFLRLTPVPEPALSPLIAAIFVCATFRQRRP